MMDRNKFIQSALDSGYNRQQINEFLLSKNEKGLSKLEQTYIDNGVFGKNILERTAEGGKNFIQGLGSIGGMVGLGATDLLRRTLGEDTTGTPGRVITDNAKSAIKGYGSKLVNNETNPIADAINLILPPGMSLEGLKNTPIETVKQTIAEGSSDPFMTGLYIAPGVPKGSVAKAASKLPIVGKSSLRKGILPTNEERKINEILNLKELKAAKTEGKVSKIQEELKTLPQGELEQVVKNLTTGEWTPGTEKTTLRVKELLDNLNKDYLALGKAEDSQATMAINQKIKSVLDPEGTKKITDADIKNAILEPTTKRLEKLGVDEDTLAKITESASNLYDQGKITAIPQRGLNKNTGITNVDLSNMEQGTATADRYLGTASFKEIADNFPEIMRKSYNVIDETMAAKQGINEIVKTQGRKVSLDEINKLAKGERVISPKSFSNDTKLIETSEDLSKAVSKLNKLSETEDISKYSKDLFAVPESTLEAFGRAYGIDSKGFATKILSTFNEPWRLWTRQILNSVPYIVGNRIANTTLNTIEGSLPQYLSVMKKGLTGEIKGLIPDYIRQSSSFGGINPDFMAEGLLKQQQRQWNKAGELIKSDSNINKAIGIADRLSQLTGGTVIGSTESTLELIDRTANYFHQAAEYGKQIGKTRDEILNLARTDEALQRKLINKVNETMGNFIGKNYFVDANSRAYAKLISPFYKVGANMRDVMAKQLRDRWLNTYATTIGPSRFGADISTFIDNQANQPTDNDLRGGITTGFTYSKLFPSQKTYNNYNPFAAVGDIGLETILSDNRGRTGLASIGEKLSTNPAAQILNALQGKDMYGNTAVGPNTYTVNGKVVTLDDNGNEIKQDPDYVAAVTQVGKTLFPAASWVNKTILPVAATIMGKDYYTPTSRSMFGQIGDTSIPYLSEGNTDTIPFNNPNVFIPYLTGTRTRNVYSPYEPHMTTRDLKGAVKKKAKQQILKQQRSY